MRHRMLIMSIVVDDKGDIVFASTHRIDSSNRYIINFDFDRESHVLQFNENNRFLQFRDLNSKKIIYHFLSLTFIILQIASFVYNKMYFLFKIV